MPRWLPLLVLLDAALAFVLVTWRRMRELG